MIRPLLITAGSRGDIEPLLALADGLTQSETIEHTTLVIPQDLVHLAPVSPKLTVISLKYNVADSIKCLADILTPENAPKLFTQDPSFMLKVVGAVIRGLVLPDVKRVVEHALEARITVVMSTFMTVSISRIISEKLHIPHISLHLQPRLPSAYYPAIGIHPAKAVIAMMHLQNGEPEKAYDESNCATYSSINKTIPNPILPNINAERAAFGLPPLSSDDIIDFETAQSPDSHIMIATQAQLTPRAPDLPLRAYIVGSLASAYIPPGWEPSALHAALEQFIADGPPPVVVSYGSMDAQGVPDIVMRELLKGLRAANASRVVLLPGRAGLGLHHLDKSDPLDAELLEWASNRVFVTKGNVQYAWLLPKCAMLFCHCGAGTTSSALRAGIPVLGTPVISDQKFFVELLSRMKLGARVGTIGVATITAEEVERGFKVGSSEEVKEKARAFGEVEKKQIDSVSKVCTMIEEISLRKM